MNTALRLLIGLAAGYATIVLLVFLLQRRLLYLPHRAAPDPAECARRGLRPWPAAGAGYRAFVGVHSPSPARGTVIVFHGNAGAAWHRVHYVRALEPLGYRVMLAEYPGYGGRAGAPSEAALVADAGQTVRQAHAEFGDPIVLWGESLGCGVVAAAAAAPAAPIAGLVLATPWDSLVALAQRLYPLLPVRWLLRDRFDSLANLAGVGIPVAVVIAERDRTIPPAHARRLGASLSGPSRVWVMPGAGHNDWAPPAADAWWSEVMSFVAPAPRHDPGAHGAR